LKIIGLDIGGANLKICELDTDKKKYTCNFYHIPIWIKGLDGIKEILRRINFFDYVSVTMTAELSDYFRTKREGVKKICEMVIDIFNKDKVYFLNNRFQLLNFDEVDDLLTLAGANWCSTSWFVSKLEKDILLIDVGSTTTDIIPIKDHRPIPQGFTDDERLTYGELIYTGALRTNLCSIVSKVPFRGREVRVSSELFALSGDIHLILGNIKEEDYITETADKRGKNFKDSLNRVAHLICLDESLVTEEDIIHICKYIYQRQLDQIKEGILQVLSRVKLSKFMVCGLGKDFLAKKALEQLGFNNIKDLSDLIGYSASLTAPSFCICFMLLDKLGGLKGWFNF